MPKGSGLMMFLQPAVMETANLSDITNMLEKRNRADSKGGPRKAGTPVIRDKGAVFH